MGWRIELRCVTAGCPRADAGVVGTSVKNVSADARRAGWIQDRDGRWRCAGCAPAFTMEDTDR